MMLETKVLVNCSNEVKYINIENQFVRFILVTQLSTLISKEVWTNVNQYC
jgi:hypothetical protein